MAEEEIKYCKHCKENNCGNILCREKINYIKTLEESIEDWKADHEHNLELMQGLNERIAELEKENERMKGILLRNDETIKTLNDIKNQKCIEIEELKKNCDFNCPVHKLATHNACLTCPAVRNSPHHDLKNVTDEELQKIIKDAEAEMEM